RDRRERPAAQADAAQVAALVRAAVHHDRLTAAVSLAGEHRRQIPAGLRHEVTAQLHDDPGRRRSLHQPAQFAPAERQVQLAVPWSVWHSETAAQVDGLGDYAQHVGGAEGLVQGAAQVLHNHGGVEYLRAGKDVKADDPNTTAANKLSAAPEVVKRQTE